MSYIKISIGESIKIKVNGLLVITNWVRNYAPAFYLVNYGGPSYEHIAGRTFDSIDLAASFEGSDLVLTSTGSLGATVFYSYQSIAL